MQHPPYEQNRLAKALISSVISLFFVLVDYFPYIDTIILLLNFVRSIILTDMRTLINFVAENFFRKPPVRNPPAFLPRPLLRAGISRGRANPFPRQIVSPCLVRISIFNHLDFARNSFELCPTNTAKIENRNRKPKWGRHEVPTQMDSQKS